NEDETIYIYTLGVNGAKIINAVGYEMNYWVEYRIEDILKRILFFSLYERFYPSDLAIAPDPFIGSMIINGKNMYVYVVRGDISDLMMYLKWSNFNKRIIFIAEELTHLTQLKPFIQNMRL